MKTNYLFPHRYKWVSGALFAIAFVLLTFLFVYTDYEDSQQLKIKVFAIADGFLDDNVYFKVVENSVPDELLMLIVLVSGLVFAFSREKQEDEMVAAIRLNSLAWATIANYMILLFCYLFIYGMPFLNVLMGAMLSQLVIFIVLFRYKMYRFNNPRQDEE